MNIGDLGALISVISLVLMYCIAQPLKQSISGLALAVNRLTDKMDNQETVNNEFRERITKVEASSASAHKRLDAIERK